jgi:hypothetical protein
VIELIQHGRFARQKSCEAPRKHHFGWLSFAVYRRGFRSIVHRDSPKEHKVALLRNRSRRRNWTANIATLVGLTVAVAAAACGRNAASVTSPSGAAPASLDHTADHGGHKHFTVSISNPSLGANQSVALHFTVTNCGAATPGCTDGASTNNLGSAQIVIPNGFTVTAVGNFGGTFTSPNWDGSFSGQIVTVGASGDAAGTHKLTPGQSETFDVTVTTPLVCDTFPITTPKASNSTFADNPTFGTDWDFYSPLPNGLALTTTGCAISGSCDAAPSVAAHYLHFVKGIHPGSNTYQNIVSQVAQHMGPQTDFDGINACTHPAYENAVTAYVDSLLP